MTEINNLIRLAKRRPSALVIRPRSINRIAEHMMATMHVGLSREEMRQAIRAGKVKMLGVPLKVGRI